MCNAISLDAFRRIVCLVDGLLVMSNAFVIIVGSYSFFKCIKKRGKTMAKMASKMRQKRKKQKAEQKERETKEATKTKKKSHAKVHPLLV